MEGWGGGGMEGWGDGEMRWWGDEVGGVGVERPIGWRWGGEAVKGGWVKGKGWFESGF
jgi:hypothetical protein